MTVLDNIRSRIRRVTGRPSENQLSTDDLDDYINDFLKYELPSHTRYFYSRQFYSFELTPNVGSYSIETIKNDYMTFEPPAYIDNYEIQFMQNEEAFYQLYENYKYSTTFATGSGIAGPYAGDFSYTPIEHETVVISTTDAAGNLITAIDDGTGGFVDQTGAAIAGATINYETGVVAGITFTAVVPAGNTIYISATRYVTGRPFVVLYFHNEFKFYPFPDRGYTFKLVTYKNPEELTAGNPSPELNLWADTIIYGTALKIFGDNLDMDSYAKVQVLFDEHKRLAERRTLKQLSTQRVGTIYSQDIQSRNGFYSFPYGG